MKIAALLVASAAMLAAAEPSQEAARLNAISRGNVDAAVMTQSSAAVVSTKQQRMADFVANALQLMHLEQSQLNVPRGVVLLNTVRDVLKQPSDDMFRVGFLYQKTTAQEADKDDDDDDDDDKDDDKKDERMEKKKKPKKPKKTEQADDEKEDGDDKKDERMETKKKPKKPKKPEQWLGGLGFGWRYPLSYWNLYGGGIGGCGLGVTMGPYYYC